MELLLLSKLRSKDGKERRMTDTFEFTLDNPLTEEQWDMITDVDFDRTDRIAFRTKHGKEVEFAKVIRCKDCKFSMSGIDKYNERYILCQLHERSYGVIDDGFCNWAERKEE